MRIISLFAVFLAVFIAGCGVTAPAWAKANPRYASIIVDADTGAVLSQSNPDKSLHPASLTKVMTLLLVFEALDQGKLSLRDRVYFSRHAAGMVPSKLDIPAGSSIKVQDAIYAVVTKSANDVAAALAEKLGGTESNFARMMTARARQLGMRNTNFVNASGLHHPRQVSSARDMAILARTVINNYPGYYRYFSTANFSYGGRNYHNHNRLMETYKGMDGMKTGYVGPSGFNLVASAVRGDRRLIGVVFGGRTAASRNTEMASLLDAGFSKIGRLPDVQIASAEKLAPAAAPVVPITAKEPPPLPPRKPPFLVALNSISAASTPAKEPKLKLASMNPLADSDKFSELTGEGDMDLAESNRIQTGLVAVSAIQGEEVKLSRRMLTAPSADDSWAIQIGAFSSRAATDQALSASARKLPAALSGGNPTIAPLKVKDGWVFRARLAGYSRDDAFRACKYIKDCMPVAPQNN